MLLRQTTLLRCTQLVVSFMWSPHVTYKKPKRQLQCLSRQRNHSSIKSEQQNMKLDCLAYLCLFLIRKMNGFVVITRERVSKGFSSFSSSAIRSLWDPIFICALFGYLRFRMRITVFFLTFLGITVKSEPSGATVSLCVQYQAQMNNNHQPALLISKYDL